MSGRYFGGMISSGRNIPQKTSIGTHRTLAIVDAISGVLAGYVTLFPHARVVTLVPIFIFIHFMEVPAGIFIVLWFVLQLVQGYLSLGMIAEGGGGVAWFAHIGGFLAGLVCIRLFYKKPKGRRRRWAR